MYNGSGGKRKVKLFTPPCLQCRAIPHQMLNARPQYVRREAKVIAQAGVPEIITIATNMAGRGVDILMGGNPEGLAQMALEQLILKPHLSGTISWLWLPLPSFSYSTFKSPRGTSPPRHISCCRRTHQIAHRTTWQACNMAAEVMLRGVCDCRARMGPGV